MGRSSPHRHSATFVPKGFSEVPHVRFTVHSSSAALLLSKSAHAKEETHVRHEGTWEPATATG
jgi:hypothetical protein